MTGLEEGASYEFRVRPANAAGVGMASMATDPLCAKAVEGNVEPQRSQSVNCFGSVFKRVTSDVFDSRSPRGVVHGGSEVRRHSSDVRVVPNERGLALCLEERLQGDHRVLQGGDQDRGQRVSESSDPDAEKLIS